MISRCNHEQTVLSVDASGLSLLYNYSEGVGFNHNIMKAKVITLIQPNSIQVAERCVDSGKKHGVDVGIFRAITPDDEPLELLEREKIPPMSFDDTRNSIASLHSCHTTRCGKNVRQVKRTMQSLNTMQSSPHPSQPNHFSMR